MKVYKNDEFVFVDNDTPESLMLDLSDDELNKLYEVSFGNT